MKTLFSEQTAEYTPESCKLENRVRNLLRPIFAEYMRQGYSQREISHILISAIFTEECRSTVWHMLGHDVMEDSISSKSLTGKPD